MKRSGRAVLVQRPPESFNRAFACQSWWTFLVGVPALLLIDIHKDVFTPIKCESLLIKGLHQSMPEF